MQPSKEVTHKGIIDIIESDLVRINFYSISACGSCHAKGLCAMSEMQEKTIEIKGNFNSFSIGEEVDVVMKLSQGFKALFLGYIIPFIILLISLISLLSLTKMEGLSALISIGILVPYYVI
ncbi:MAG: SoxR reducing system RseC family protein, partial [Bacteroidota bacterium]